MANFEVSEMHMVVGPCFRNVTMILQTMDVLLFTNSNK